MSESLSAIVAANFGKELEVLCQDGSVVTCELSSNLGVAPVPGDRVNFRQEGDKRYLEKVEERSRVLRRAGHRAGDEKILAAHVDLVVVVSAVKPALKEGLIDRYLVAVHHEGMTPVVVLNKCDLDDGDHAERMLVYSQIGYPVHLVSASTGVGIAALRKELAGKTSVLVGHSGVGKSSLLMALVPEVETNTGSVSSYSGKGRHTTTTARMYAGLGGVRIIDSPGIRSFGLSGVERRDVRDCFVEFEAPAAQCRFRDCLHLGDEGCEVRAALDRGEITRIRYESYCRILESL